MTIPDQLTHPAAARKRLQLIGMGLLSLLLLTACTAMLPTRPIPPTVSVADVRPLNFSLREQKLALTLRVQNPNAFELPVQSLDFIANLAGEPIASGRSAQSVIIPANGEAELKVTVLAGVSKLVNRVKNMFDTATVKLDYGVTGNVKLANWPQRIPFNVDGVLENPLETSTDNPEATDKPPASASTQPADDPQRSN